MRARRLRDLFGRPPDPGRIFWSALWFREHNNARYAELLPRLERIDAYFLTCSGARIPRGLQFRAYRAAPGGLAQHLLAGRVSRLYRGMLCTEFRQIPLFRGPVVVDVDDPFFSEPDLALFRHAHVAALVTLSGWAAERFRELGVTAPIHVVPQGVDLSTLPRQAPLVSDGTIVAGYTASLLATAEDAGVDSLYHVDHLLELWDEIHSRLPEGRLRLVGEATERLRRRLAGREDVELTGRVSRAEVLGRVASFDVALYPRARDEGIQAVKIAEYLGAGIPTVSYDYRVADILRETGSGLVVSSAREFVEAVVRLARDEAERRRLAEAARSAGAELDWSLLARRYETEILDRYLPPA